MAELDLTEAIEAAADAIDAERDIDVNPNALAEAAVRAAAPIIERAVREPLITLLARLTDHESGSCELDHHSYCRTHSLHPPPCPVPLARARVWSYRSGLSR